MTTIACDGKTMAGDGMLTLDGMVVSRGDAKLTKVKGLIVGAAGDTCYCDRFIDHLKGKEIPKIGDAFQGLTLDQNGKITYYYSDEDQLCPVEVDAPAVIGSGGQIALGAMLAGANARRAVQIASSRDTSSGGKIKTLRLS